MPKKRTRKRRVLSGLGAPRKKKRRSSRKKSCKHGVSKTTGRCLKNPRPKKRRGKKRGKKRATKKAGRVYSMSSSLPFKKGKKGRKVLKKGCRKITSGTQRGKIRCMRKMSRRKRAA